MILSNIRDILAEAAKDVFEKMTQLAIRFENLNGKRFENTAHLSASVSFVGDWTGSVSLTCLGNSARFVTSKLLGTALESTSDPDVKDAMGEMANMIGGRFKALFAEKCNGGREAFRMSVPTVVTGREFQVFASDSLNGGAKWSIGIGTADHFFDLCLVLKPNRAV
jgi:chemotaxis protein CheX